MDNDNANPIVPASDEQPKPETFARTERGLFAKGNRGGPGRPAGNKILALEGLLKKAVTEEEELDIIRQIKDIALKPGSEARDKLKAAEWLFDRRYGKPRQVVDLQGAMAMIGDNHPSTVVDAMIREIAAAVSAPAPGGQVTVGARLTMEGKECQN